MKDNLKLVDNAKSQIKKHKEKVRVMGLDNSEKLNEEAAPKILTPEANYEFNTKRPIPENMEIAFKDGNPANQKFANLILVHKKAEEPKKDIKK
jgi:hypothetical protein